jgi:hypothetical protein
VDKDKDKMDKGKDRVDKYQVQAVCCRDTWVIDRVNDVLDVVVLGGVVVVPGVVDKMVVLDVERCCQVENVSPTLVVILVRVCVGDIVELFQLLIALVLVVVCEVGLLVQKVCLLSFLVLRLGSCKP